MVVQRSSSGNTSCENQTDVMDYFCTELPVGPLAWLIFSVPCSVIGVPASMWLLWSLLQRQRNGLANDTFVLNLTVMDFIFNISVVPCAVNVLVMLDKQMLAATKFLYSFNMAGRPLFMACICVDCYMAVVHPIVYMKMRNSNHRMMVCMVVWTLTLLDGMAFVINFSVFTTSVMVIPLAATVPVIILTNLCVLRALRKPDPSGRSDIHPLKQRALQIITISLVMAVVSYFPPLLAFGLADAIPLDPQDKLCMFSIPVLKFSTFGSTILPLLHLRNLGCFRCPGGFRSCTWNM